MKKIKWITLFEACKEPLRLLFLGIISWAITYLVPQMSEAWAIPLTIVLRFADKLLYEYGKQTKNDLLAGGITRF